jgi:hypothetical protein
MTESNWQGEIVVTIGGHERTLRPSWAALKRIEREAGPLFDLLDAFARGRASLSAVVSIITACLEAGGARSPVTGYAYTEAEVYPLITGKNVVPWVEIAAALASHLGTSGTAGRALLGEASRSVLAGIIRRIDGQAVTAPALTGPAITDLPLPVSG